MAPCRRPCAAEKIPRTALITQNEALSAPRVLHVLRFKHGNLSKIDWWILHHFLGGRMKSFRWDGMLSAHPIALWAFACMFDAHDSSHLQEWLSKLEACLQQLQPTTSNEEPSHQTSSVATLATTSGKIQRRQAKQFATRTTSNPCY